jgi:hypothetical protein
VTVQQSIPDPRDRAYWDTPDTAVRPDRDPFSVFLINETSVERLRDLGMDPQELMRHRDVLNHSYMEWRNLLAERWSLLDAARRGEYAYLRQVLPEVLFWPPGGVLGPWRTPHG